MSIPEIRRIVSVLMNRHCGGIGCKSQQRFRLRFQRLLREYLARRRSAAESFGPAWERALEEVPLEEAEQAEVYWQLIQWTKSFELFTATDGSVAVEFKGNAV